MIGDNGIIAALLAALLFGASTPLSKLVVGDVQPLLLAGLLYFASGAGLLVYRLLHGFKTFGDARIHGKDMLWLGLAILSGGVMGPALLMTGLARTSGSAASLLLNLESVLTALVAWVVFREHFHRRIGVGMAVIAAGGLLLSWDNSAAVRSWIGPALIAGACLAWALDNNFTRNVSDVDPVIISCLKGLIAGSVNIALALQTGARLPAIGTLVFVGIVGILGYGISLVLFVVALRQIGTSRTGAYFATAPFAGAVLSVIILREQPPLAFWCAAALMAWGVWLHITEHHSHDHLHETLEHTHPHTHDKHHQHAHDSEPASDEAHTHAHQHLPLHHFHPHFPDVHHRHSHTDAG